MKMTTTSRDMMAASLGMTPFQLPADDDAEGPFPLTNLVILDEDNYPKFDTKMMEAFKALNKSIFTYGELFDFVKANHDKKNSYVFEGVDATNPACVRVVIVPPGVTQRANKGWVISVQSRGVSYRTILGSGAKNFFDTDMGADFLASMVMAMDIPTIVNLYPKYLNKEGTPPFLMRILDMKMQGLIL